MPHVNPFLFNNPYTGTAKPETLAPGIVGTLGDGPKGMYLLFFYSEVENKGRAGRFLDGLKEKYPIIRVPNVMNPLVEGMLSRRGFKKKYEYVPALKIHTEVYVWKRT